MSRKINPTEAQGKTLAEWGIKCVPAEHFLVNGFRYTHLADAVNEARRVRLAGAQRIALTASASSIVDGPPQAIWM
jgi:hypothetical protein